MTSRGRSTRCAFPRGMSRQAAPPPPARPRAARLYMMQFQSMGISLRNQCGETILYFFFSEPSLPSPCRPAPGALSGTATNEASSDINELILDYLTIAGYPNAAARFSAEANLQPQQDHPSMVARQQIQRSIQQGDVETAIDALNELDPEVCRCYILPSCSPPFCYD